MSWPRTAPAAVCGDQLLELGDQFAVPAERQLRLDPLLESGEAQLLQPGDLARGERLVREVGQRRSPPQRERLGAASEPPAPVGRRPGRLPLLEQALEAAGVDGVGLDIEGVARSPGGDRDGQAGQRLAQPVDVALERHRGRGRCAVPPDLVDEVVEADGGVGVDGEEGQHRPLAQAAEDDGSFAHHGERPEHPDLTPVSPLPPSAIGGPPTARRGPGTRFQRVPTGSQPLVKARAHAVPVNERAGTEGRREVSHAWFQHPRFLDPWLQHQVGKD